MSTRVFPDKHFTKTEMGSLGEGDGEGDGDAEGEGEGDGEGPAHEHKNGAVRNVASRSRTRAHACHNGRCRPKNEPTPPNLTPHDDLTPAP